VVVFGVLGCISESGVIFAAVAISASGKAEAVDVFSPFPGTQLSGRRAYFDAAVALTVSIGWPETVVDLSASFL
jgi:hypothetical protein